MIFIEFETAGAPGGMTAHDGRIGPGCVA